MPMKIGKLSLLRLCVFIAFCLFSVVSPAQIIKKQKILTMPPGYRLIYALQDVRGAFLAVAGPIWEESGDPLFVDEGIGFRQTEYFSFGSALLSPDGKRVIWTARVEARSDTEELTYLECENERYGPFKDIGELLWSSDSVHFAIKAYLTSGERWHINGKDIEAQSVKYFSTGHGYAMQKAKGFSIVLDRNLSWDFMGYMPNNIFISSGGFEFAFVLEREGLGFFFVSDKGEYGPFALCEFLGWKGSIPRYAALRKTDQGLSWSVFEGNTILLGPFPSFTTPYPLYFPKAFSDVGNRFAYAYPNQGKYYIKESKGIHGPFSNVTQICYSSDGSTFLAVVDGFWKTSLRATDVNPWDMRADSWIYGDGYRFSLQEVLKTDFLKQEKYLKIKSVAANGSSLLASWSGRNVEGLPAVWLARDGKGQELFISDKKWALGLDIPTSAGSLPSIWIETREDGGKYVWQDGKAHGPYSMAYEKKDGICQAADALGQWMVDSTGAYGPFDGILFDLSFQDSVSGEYVFCTKEAGNYFLRCRDVVIGGPYGPRFKGDDLNSRLYNGYCFYSDEILSAVINMDGSKVVNLTLVQNGNIISDYRNKGK